MPTLLVVDDEESVRYSFRRVFQAEDVQVLTAASAAEGLAVVARDNPDVIVLDLQLPDRSGLEVFREVHARSPKRPVIFITAHGTTDTAIEAMKGGAFDYITKPVEFDELLLLVDRVSERRTLMKENEILRGVFRGEPFGAKGVTTDRIVYRSEKMSALINMAGRVATSRATVLLQGESGTGKELLARLIHQLSPRSTRPIIAVNCGALHENLLESELFGHEIGRAHV
jgi:DNA-binding NtrC family response regulator